MRSVNFLGVAKNFYSAKVTRWLTILSLILLFHPISVLARQVTLAWDANSEPILGGYRLYYGQTSRNYTFVEDVGNQINYTLFGLADDRPYYFAVTAYDTTKRIESAFSNEVFLSPATLLANLESPYQGSFESGIGLIRGWICQANTVEVQIDGGERQLVAYGTTRNDTAEVCGDADNGFGYTFNWNHLGNGTHTLRAFADNLEFANVTFTVTTLGVDYLRGASGEYILPNFPLAGQNVTLRWTEPHQNFVIVGASRNPASAPATSIPLAASLASLESPYQGSFESGIGLIRGWVCQANTVEIQIDGGERQWVAYGTTRNDTAEVCGDADNGFGYTFNWNALGNGTHQLQVFADGAEFANVTFTVTTLGVDYLRGASGEYTLPNFPLAGQNVTVRWAEPHQNFVIVGSSSP